MSGIGSEAVLPPSDVPDSWNVYLSRDLTNPSSTLYNHWFHDHAPVKGTDTLFWVDMKIQDQEPHGMGGSDTKDKIGRLEDQIFELAAKQGFYGVAHVRGNGVWKVVLYGPGDGGVNLDEAVRNVLSAAKIPFETGSRPDPKWSYYFDTLFPDAERWRWICDSWVVENLRKHGDSLEKRRNVDHWIYFSRKEDQEAFIKSAMSEGFKLTRETYDSLGERPFGVHLSRTDSVKLDDIHQVVMKLFNLSKKHNGEYDGWETSVEK